MKTATKTKKRRVKKLYAIFSEYENQWISGLYSSLSSLNRDLAMGYIDIQDTDNECVIYEVKPISTKHIIKRIQII